LGRNKNEGLRGLMVDSPSSRKINLIYHFIGIFASKKLIIFLIFLITIYKLARYFDKKKPSIKEGF
jgi:hypothetical protein